ncbi:MAG: DUF2027 domain-containing protein [Dysgonamonadaceae bacterium]|jgi:hypothetical protein|nr:DUF2027 domain-containing protein [Dysgonamonadaceae bacterium]
MKIGDKVRFLNAAGGGIVRGFKSKDIVIIEEDDGFETPVLIRECIVVGEDNKPVVNNKEVSIPKLEIKPELPEEKYEITELSGKDRLNVYLAYLPLNIKMVGKCNYEAFLVNDSNYYLFFNYMSCQNKAWTSRCSGTVEPNTRLFIEEFAKEQLKEMEKICIQFIAFKKDKPYSLKNTYSMEFHIDEVNFYKLHSFRENDFFEDEALIYPVVINDAARGEMLISDDDLQKAVQQKAKIDLKQHLPEPAKKAKQPEIVEVDLHINQLIDSTAGLTNTDMLNIQLDKFRQTMTEYKNKRGQKIVFIHGKGEGVLKNAILMELKSKYKHLPVQDASFKEYGFGATMVTVR